MDLASWQDIAEERVDEGVTRKMFRSRDIAVTQWECNPGTSLPIREDSCEHVILIERGESTLLFPGEPGVTLCEGTMAVIPPSQPCMVKIGPGGCLLLDLTAPIPPRGLDEAASQDLRQNEDCAGGELGEKETSAMDPYKQLQGSLCAAGIKIPLEKLRELPVDLLARYVYERECITLAQLRDILGIDKAQAKELLRQWKHGDDHSEASLRRNLRWSIVSAGEKKLP